MIIKITIIILILTIIKSTFCLIYLLSEFEKKGEVRFLWISITQESFTHM